jgi:hypothetical protein
VKPCYASADDVLNPVMAAVDNEAIIFLSPTDDYWMYNCLPFSTTRLWSDISDNMDVVQEYSVDSLRYLVKRAVSVLLTQHEKKQRYKKKNGMQTEIIKNMREAHKGDKCECVIFDCIGRKLLKRSLCNKHLYI